MSLLRLVAFLFCCCSASAFAEETFNVEGSWHGTLRTPLGNLRLIVHVERSRSGLMGSLDSPDQGAQNLPIDEITFDGKRFKFKSRSLRITYNGTLQDDQSISGKFSQAGQRLRLKLSKQPTERIARPQTPNPPFPYEVEELTLANKRLGTVLAGSLTIPDDVKGVVILISGSGQQDRDSQIAGHRPFRVIADHLSRAGIATFRYDDRGIGESVGDLENVTIEVFAQDVVPATRYLKSRFNKPIGLIGHSEGGSIATLVASEVEVDFLVWLAAPALSGIEVLSDQNERIFRASGFSQEDIAKRLAILNGANQQVLNGDRKTLTKYLKQQYKVHGKQEMIRLGFPEQWRNFQEILLSAWMQRFLSYDPMEALSELSLPMLALYGEKDLQVNATHNLARLKTIVAEDLLTSEVIPTANHLFQSADTGLPAEYFQIEQTIMIEVLDQLENWIVAQTENRK